MRRREEKEKINLEQYLQDIRTRISKSETTKEDLELIICSMVEFFAGERPEILEKGKPVEKVAVDVFKVLMGTGADYLNPFTRGQVEKKFQKFMYLFEVIKRYGNVED